MLWRFSNWNSRRCNAYIQFIRLVGRLLRLLLLLCGIVVDFKDFPLSYGGVYSLGA